MDHVKYVILNGEPLKKSEPVFYNYNRAFRFGDAIFESMHANGTETQFFDKHFERLCFGMKLFQMEIPDTFTSALLYSQIKSLLVRNKLYQGAKVRLTVYREGEGTYTPETNKISYLIESEKIKTDQYELNQIGFNVDLYPSYKKSIQDFSLFKNNNSILYVLASIYKKEKGLDDVFIVNENNHIIEATSSNIFIVRNNQIFTPSVDEGCVNGIMRNVIIDLALQHQITVFDDGILSHDDVLSADEVFLTNAVSGIRWVLAYKDRRYFNKTSRFLIQALNQKAFS